MDDDRDRGVRFGVSFEADVGWREMLEVSRELDRESLYDHLWVTDGLVGRDPDGARLEAWTSLAALAVATERVRLGVLVSGNTCRHPSVLAKMATTVDHVSGGRLEFGIGAGFPGEAPRLGLPFYDAAERVARLDEALRLIKALWTESRPTFRGRHYELDAAPFSPGNVQEPHPPITVGGKSDSLIRIAARHADALNVEGTPEEVAGYFGRLTKYCVEAGRDPSEVRRSLEVMLFLTDVPAIQDTIVSELRRTLDRSEEGARRLVLLGSGDEVRAQVEEYVRAGVDDFIVWQVPRVHAESLLRFSREVIPAFR